VIGKLAASDKLGATIVTSFSNTELLPKQKTSLPEGAEFGLHDSLPPNPRPHSTAARPARVWHGSSSPDLPLLERLAGIQNACLLFAAVLSIIILAGWLVPGFGSMLPVHWAWMKANTAMLTLFCAGSLTFSRRIAKTTDQLYSRRRQLLSQALAAIVCLVAAIVLFEYFSGVQTRIDVMLAADIHSPMPGRMSPQSATAFLLLGVILLFLRVKHRVGGLIVDLLVFCLCPLIMVIVSGYAFDVMHFFGVTPATRTAPQTLLALTLLTLVVFLRRSESGFYSVLTGSGIGSKIARVAAPLALLLPFVLEVCRFGLAQADILSRPYATASVTAVAAVLGFSLVLGLSRYIGRQEQEILSLSLRDDLTHIYNRRGFFLLAERELYLARQSLVPFSVIFLDLDGLKRVNDTLGHESGSDFLKETAELIQQCFRDSDVIARIGGDEFVAAFVAGEPEAAQRLSQLQQAAIVRNQQPDRRYLLSFSLGAATLKGDNGTGVSETLEALMKRADEAMYADKLSRR
jgi:diguanylate cyclase (GGDEF)-like protein